MKLYFNLIFILLTLLLYTPTFAQDNIPTDSLDVRMKQMQGILNSLSKIRISGYVQSQFQAANALGINSYEGGNFPAASGNRFMVRRGRLKVQHTGKYSLGVFQIDATERGVGVKDAFVTLSEPWLKTFSVTAGIFNRPFGFEVPYSSSERESPERARMMQILFPGERDLGAMISIQPSTTAIKFLRIDAGLFNGNGTASDFDSNKDFIGRLRLNEVVKNEVLKLSVAGSYYNGVWRQENTTIYEIGINSNNIETFVSGEGFGKSKHGAPRQHIGADAQISIKWIAGTTTLRGEYVFGKQSGLANSSTSPSTSAPPVGNVYLRNFDGAIFYFIQNIMNSNHQLVVKYDWYDPNVDVAGMAIGATGSNLGAAEIRYQSLGFGGNLQIDNNLKFMAFYQTVQNEKTNLTGFTEDIKDDVITLRLQYKF